MPWREAALSPLSRNFIFVFVFFLAESKNQRRFGLVRGTAGHIEQAERGAIRKSPRAHKHFCPLLPTAMVFVSYRFVLVQVQVNESLVN